MRPIKVIQAELQVKALTQLLESLNSQLERVWLSVDGEDRERMRQLVHLMDLQSQETVSIVSRRNQDLRQLNLL